MMSRTVLSILALSFALCGQASATVPGSPEEGGHDNGMMIAGTLIFDSPFLALGLGLAIADAVYAADGEWAPTGLAVTEIVGGALMGAMGVLTLSIGSTHEVPIALGSSLAVMGPALIGHGIASIALGEDENAPKAEINVMPTRGGAAGSVTIRF